MHLNLFATGFFLAAVNAGSGQPVILSQPQSQTNVACTAATFSVTASGTAPLTYRWQRDTGSLDFHDFADATNTILVLTNVAPSDAVNYRVIVTSASGSITSAVAHLTVLARPPTVIFSPPQSQSVSLGGSVTFAVSVQGMGPFTYQWQFEDVNLPGATTSTVSLANLGFQEAGRYTVTVGDACGAVTSAVAYLTVLGPTQISQPTTVCPSVQLGGRQGLRVSALGTLPLSFQWLKDGVALSGQTNEQINFPSVQLTNLGLYAVVVTNSVGAITSAPVRLDVSPSFTGITTGPLVTDLGTPDYGAWGDYDGDGYPDVFVARYHNGLSALYHNNGDGTFTALTNAPFAQKADASLTGAFADLNNDGNVDLIVARDNEPATVYFNNGDGTFNPVQLAEASPFNVAVMDFDNDGFLDLLFYGNTFPLDQTGVSWLYRNNGDGTFTRMTSQQVGSIASFAASGGVASAADYDDDGAVDVFCANLAGSGRLFHNDGTGRFTADTNLVLQNGVNGGAWGDYDNDGRLDFCAPAYFNGGVNDGAFVYRNLGGGQFKIAAFDQTPRGYYSSASWVDYDNDGFLDLFLTGSDGSQNALYHNNGDGTFARITNESVVTDQPAAGAAGSYAGLWFDFDNDGFLDLFVFNGNDDLNAITSNFLYRNNGNCNAWLKVKLVGTASNRDAVGAKVRIEAQYAGQVRWQRRDISGGDVMNSNQLYAHFGLGDATNVITLRIEWPSGIVQELNDLPVNQSLTVTEPVKLSMPRVGELHIQCWKNMMFNVLTSTNLIDWTYQATVINTNLTGGIQWIDPNAPGQSTRFYGVALFESRGK